MKTSGRKMGKRFLAFLLTLLMLCSMLPMSAFAEGEGEDGGADVQVEAVEERVEENNTPKEEPVNTVTEPEPNDTSDGGSNDDKPAGNPEENSEENTQETPEEKTEENIEEKPEVNPEQTEESETPSDLEPLVQAIRDFIKDYKSLDKSDAAKLEAALPQLKAILKSLQERYEALSGEDQAMFYAALEEELRALLNLKEDEPLVLEDFFNILKGLKAEEPAEESAEKTTEEPSDESEVTSAEETEVASAEEGGEIEIPLAAADNYTYTIGGVEDRVLVPGEPFSAMKDVTLTVTDEDDAPVIDHKCAVVIASVEKYIDGVKDAGYVYDPDGTEPNADTVNVKYVVTYKVYNEDGQAVGSPAIRTIRVIGALSYALNIGSDRRVAMNDVEDTLNGVTAKVLSDNTWDVTNELGYSVAVSGMKRFIDDQEDDSYNWDGTSMLDTSIEGAVFEVTYMLVKDGTPVLVDDAPFTSTCKYTIASGNQILPELDNDDEYISMTRVDMSTGTEPFDANDKPGNDSSKENNVVRSFDNLTYKVYVSSARYTDLVSYEKGYIHYRFVLPVSKDLAEFDTTSMGWMDVNTHKWHIDTETVDGKECQVLYCSLLLDSTVSTAQNAFPCMDASANIVIRVKGMPNGAVIAPEGYAWLDHNHVNPKDPSYVCEDVNHQAAPNGGRELAVFNLEPVIVSAAPQYNVTIKWHGYKEVYGTFDFDTGNGNANNKGKGSVDGQLRGIGMYISLYNDIADKGFRGIELPDESKPITFDINLSSTFTDDKKTVSLPVTPLVWTVDANNRRDSKTGYNSAFDDRNLQVGGSKYYATSVPFNKGTTPNYLYCKNGGSWTGVQDPDDMSKVHITVTGFKIDMDCFPNVNAGGTQLDKSNSGAGVYWGAFSAGKLEFVIPNKDITGEDLAVKYGTGTLQTTVKDNNLNAVSVTNQTTYDTLDREQTIFTGDDVLADNFKLVPPGNGGFSQRIWYGDGSRYSNDYNHLANTTDGSCYYNGKDVGMPGQAGSMNWTVLWSTNGSFNNNLYAADSLMVFDISAFDVTGNAVFDGQDFGAYKDGGNFEYTALYAAKPDGKAWSGIDEMNSTNIEDLVYYDSRDKVQGVLVGVLLQVRAKHYFENADSSSNIGAHLPVRLKVTEDILDNVYPITFRTNVWFKANTDKYVTDVLGEVPVNNESTSSAQLLPSIINGMDAYADAMSVARAVNFRHSSVGYDPSEYDDGEWTGGHKPSGYTNGDSLYVAPYKATILKTIEQRAEDGVEGQKENFFLDVGQTVVDFKLTPALEVKTTTTTGGTTSVTVTETLPFGVNYNNDAVIGGTYVHAANGMHGTVTGGTSLAADCVLDNGMKCYAVVVGKDTKTGCTTLTFEFDNVPYGKDLSSVLGVIRYSGTIEDYQAKDGDTYLSYAVVDAEWDHREKNVNNKNKASAGFKVAKLDKLSALKVADTPFVDKGEQIEYSIYVNNVNLLSASPLEIMMDTMPDPRVYGPYTLEEMSLYMSFNDNRAATSADYENLRFFYTTDEKAFGFRSEDYYVDSALGKEADPNKFYNKTSAIDGIVWEEKSNYTALPKNTTAWCVIGTLPANAQLHAVVKILPTNPTPGDTFVNTFSMGSIETSDRAYIVRRMLSGYTWLDDDRDGKFEDDEVALPGVTATLYKVGEGGKVDYRVAYVNIKNETCSMETDKNGYYEFNYLEPGEYVVRFTNGTTVLDTRYYLTTQISDGSYSTRSTSKAAVDEQTGDYVKSANIVNINLPAAKNTTSSVYHWANQNAGFYDAIDIPVEKVWEDNGDQDKIRPAQVTIQLLADSEPVSDATLVLKEDKDDPSKNWKGAFTELPRSVKGVDIEYDIEEVTTSVITGTDSATTYAFAITGSAAAGYKVTNTHTHIPTPATLPIGVQKKISTTAWGVKPASKVTFDFVITPQGDAPAVMKDGKANTKASTLGENTASFGVITFNATGDFKYKIKETNKKTQAGFENYNFDGTEYVITVKVKTDDNGDYYVESVKDGKGNTLGKVTVNKEQMDGVVFENSYEPAPVELKLPVTKKVTGEVRPSGANTQFKFTLSTSNNAPLPKDKKTEVTITDDNTKNFTAKDYFGTIEYTAVSDAPYKYVIRETQGGGNGFANSTKVYLVEVTVSDNGKGGLKTTESWKVYDSETETEKDAKTYTVTDKGADFVNNYGYSTTSKIIPVQKTVSGIKRPKGYIDAPVSFDFVIAVDTGSEDNTPLPDDGEYTVTITDNGDKDAVLTGAYDEITFSAPGTYKYTVTETLPTTVPTGFTYDTNRVRHIEIKVEDVAGELTVTSMKVDDETADKAAFTNAYAPKSVKISLPVQKSFSSDSAKRPTKKNFVFTLTANVSTNPMPVASGRTVTIEDPGDTVSAVKKFGAITYNAAGTFYYTITETAPDPVPKGYKYPAPKTVTVTVTDNKGQLQANWSVDNKTNANAVFENIYKADPTYIDIPVSKKFSSDSADRPDPKKTFEFTISAPQGSAADYPMPDSTKRVVKIADPGKDTGSGTFGRINYTAAGEYTYTITETAPNPLPKGFTYPAAKTVKVSVVDNDGVLSASYTVDGGTDVNPDIVFENKYKTDPATLKLPVQKRFSVSSKARPSKINFEFTLAAVKSGNPMPITEAGKKVIITDPGKDVSAKNYFGEMKFTAPGDYVYTITETVPDPKPTGYSYAAPKTVTVHVSDIGGELSANYTLGSGEAISPDIIFENSYDFGNVKEQFTVQKTVNGQPRPTNGKVFTFVLAAHKDSPEIPIMPDDGVTQITVTDTNNKSVGVIYTAQFGKITYTSEGEYWYTITETAGAAGDCYTYDKTEHTVKVTVEDKNGALASTVKVDDVVSATKAVSFTNTYTPKPTTLQLPIQKEFTADSKARPTRLDFVFTLTAAKSGSPLPTSGRTVTIEDPGDTVSAVKKFGAIKFTKAGEFKYTITETAPDPVPAGYSYAKPKTITVTVTDNDGTLDAHWVVDNSTDKDKTAVFTNSYDPATAKKSFKVSKTVEGDERPADYEMVFTFTLKKGNGSPKNPIMPDDGITEITVTDTDGTPNANYTAYFGDITYTEAGEYWYTISEKKGSPDDGFIYDLKERQITVNVTDVSGELKAEVLVDKETSDTVSFTNIYTPKSTELKLPVTKIINADEEDLPRTKETFKFVLEPVGNAPMPSSAVDGKVYATVEGNGKAEFDAISYAKAGKYEYKVTEIIPDPETPGYTYDKTVHNIVVDVKDMGGQLAATWKGLNNEGTNGSNIIFTNKYEPLETSYIIPAKKYISNLKLKAGMFTFELLDEKGAVIDSATNDGLGEIAFKPIAYKTKGVYTYYVKEISGSLNRVTYDTTTYRVEVTVAPVDGQLIASMVAYKNGVTPAGEVAFHNTYTPSIPKTGYGPTNSASCGMTLALTSEGRQAQQAQAQLKQLYVRHDKAPRQTKASAAVATAAVTEESAEAAPAADDGFIEVQKNGETIRIHGDFAELYAKNDDVIGWLTAGEYIDYPVVWKENDNEYYLHNNFDKKSDANGVIFMNMANSIDPRDDVLLIHGHNMSSGAMFGTLLNFESYDYLRKYPIVTFRTVNDDKDVFYTPVAGFNASMMEGSSGYFDAGRILFDDDAQFEQYLKEIKGLSLWQSKADVNTEDRLIALITCSYEHTDGRFLLICRELRDGETPETVAALYDEEAAKA